MGTEPYNEILERAKAELSAEERLRLAAELASRQDLVAEKRRSILELEGLGKETWRRIDADQYVAQERDSWGD
ncbi:MAG: hypothetical protein ACRCT8_07785 [Lacipirellulaceae bacterium]